MDNPVASIGTPDSNRDSGNGAAMVERIRCCVEKVSLGFGRWNDPHAHGPGLYFVLERDSATAFAEPMGMNRWPVEVCGSVFSSLDVLFETAEQIAFDCDGAIIVHSDGTIKEEMVRMKQLSTAECEQTDGLPYAGWMGTRHMSALETSTREEILAVITLSEEDGRVTIFSDGTFEDYPRDAIEGRGRIND